MKIGKYELIPVETCKFSLDGGAMFGVVPKSLWQNTNYPDELNRVILCARCLLLINENRKILIDTGLGYNWDEKFMRIYNVDYTEYDMMKSMDKIGIAFEEITDIIFTHLHFDHAGGATKLVDGKWIPAFPNARYYVQKRHFDWALNPSERDKASFVEHRFKPLYDNGLLTLIDGEYNFDDEIKILISNGHTFFQQLIKISDGLNTLLFIGDLFPFTSHIPIPYITSYDLQPLITVKEKKEILNKAVEENWLLFFEHDPFTIAATVTKNDKGFSIGEKFSNLNQAEEIFNHEK